MQPVADEIVRLPLEQQPILLVEIDVEEDFDWEAPFSRQSTRVDSIRDLGVIRPLFQRFGVNPTLVVDYAVASQPVGSDSVLEFIEDLDGEVGAHQHPWVCPPHDEAVGQHNSFAGNLPFELEAAKLEVLTGAIRANLGATPRAYKAGRYGIGPNTGRILEDQNFEVDLSPNPPFDFSDEGGPDFSGWTREPYWFGDRGDLLGVPHSGGYLGFLRHFGTNLHEKASGGLLRRLRALGILARLRAFDRLHLSPEGFSAGELRRLTRFLLDEGVRVLTFSFHSPTLRPGCTPYVQSSGELSDFLVVCEEFLEFFLGEIGGTCMTASGLRDFVRQVAPRRSQ